MHVVTFYSFKGGVGRTLALVNVGVKLAQTGRRVLLVDFDLEAPGIHTFEALQPKEQHPGILEFVDDYVSTHAASDVRDYVYEAAGVGQKNGRLWVMPAGRCDRLYQAKLAGLDWQELYANHEGYLLLQDLKEQWRTAFEPDYVLIDSRTGHTDVQGICTRQLPNSVVVLFFPNKQNLDGLEGVVADIRSEEKPGDGKKIGLHFVMSNVPDLDDEEEILKQRQSEFRSRLNFTNLTALIHRYDSLTLLNQTIFTKDRPRSRLAREYSKLCDAIVEDNLEDKEGAIKLLQRALRPSRLVRHRAKRDKLTDACQQIAQIHGKDGEVLFFLGLVMSQEGSTDEAILQFDQAERTSTLPDELRPALRLERGDMRFRKGDRDGARRDVLAALDSSRTEALGVDRAVRLLREVDSSALDTLGRSTAIARLPFRDKLRAVRELSWARSGLVSIVGILEEVLRDSSISVQDHRIAQHELGLAYIGLGRFHEAISLLKERSDSDTDPDIASRFNFAMAHWGVDHRPNRNLFERVLASRPLNEASLKKGNYNQCLAIAHWAVGNADQAVDSLESGRETVSEIEFPEFSCWRYLITSPKDFLADCDEIQKLIDGEPILPLFIREVTVRQDASERAGKRVSP